MYKPILKRGIKKYNPKLDYCTFSPEGAFGCKWSRACYWHDRQYRNELVNRVCRFRADLYLWRDMIIECWKVRKTSIIWSWWIANKYFLAVRLFARRAYKNG